MSIFPFITSPEKDIVEKPQLKEYQEWAYDYDKNCLKLSGGKPYLVKKNEALKIWIFKALRTKRFVYEAYTHNYGTEIENVIGTSDSLEVQESEIKRYITECLMVNPYIQELSAFLFEHRKGKVTVTFEVTTVYDKMTYESEVYIT